MAVKNIFFKIPPQRRDPAAGRRVLYPYYTFKNAIILRMAYTRELTWQKPTRAPYSLRRGGGEVEFREFGGFQPDPGTAETATV